MLRNQAHWLVAQKADTRPKPAKELAYPNARQTVTMKQIELGNIKVDKNLVVEFSKTSGQWHRLLEIAN